MRRSIVVYVLVAVFATLPGCGGSAAGRVSSIALPGNAIISFPSSLDRVNTTLVLSKPAGQVAGVDGRTFTISSVTFDQPQDQMTIDANGNMGLHGSYHSLSSRAAKKDIRPFASDAVALLGRTGIVTFRYRGESEGAPRHVGLLAEDAPVPITDPEHRSFDLNNSVAVTMAATQQLDTRIRRLEAKVDSLESEIRALHEHAASYPKK